MNELDLYSGGGELAPYSQPLAPAPDMGNTQLTNREIDEYTRYSGGGQAVFGVALPAGVTAEQVRQGFQQLGNVFVADFMQLGHNVSQTQACVSWFLDAITNPPAKQQKRHAYNLYEHTSDPTFQAFANFAHDHKFSAKLITDACWWVTTAAKKLGSSQGKPAQGSAPIKDPTVNLSDAEFERIVKINEQAKAQTYGYLESLWGQSFKSNLRMVDAYFAALPVREQAALDQFTTGWVKALNTKEVILGLYKQAIGSHSMPSGGAVATEIAEHEHVMKTDRKRWMSDERLQARYRELLNIRDGH